MTIYLNWKTPNGIETIDEFTKKPGQSHKEFKAYVAEMMREYHLARIAVYQSSRPCKDWK